MKENPVQIFFNNKPQYILWFKGTVSKDLLRTVKMKNRGIFFNKKLHRIRGLKGMCQEKMKRNPVYDSSSFYSDTFPLILVFCADFY
jgi:hypothetical protein